MMFSIQRGARAVRQSRFVFLLAWVALLTACASAPAPRSALPPVVTKPAAPAAIPAPAPAVVVAPAARPAEVPNNTPLSEIAVAATAPLTVTMLSAPLDIWERIRRGLTMKDLEGDLVRDKEQWYASRPDYFQRMTERSSRYLFHIVEEIERRNLPMELALLPFIESAFNPQAVSSARAAGMWQFMPATGESFDLKQNVFRDDRRDVLASTRAALDYLEQLHARFGDWHLALAAYNWGQGNVNRAINRNQAQGLGAQYTDISMPLETRQYVPKLQAVENVVARPEAFGVILPNIGNHPFFDTIRIERDMDVAVITSLAGIQEQDFRSLNPSIKRPVVMAAGTPDILLPWDNAKQFEDRLKSHRGPLASWTAWVAPSTMTISQVADQVGMSDAELRAVNNIPPRMKVKAGSSLLVRRSGARDRDVSEFVADNAQLSLAPEIILNRTQVRARKGDSLARLASRYGVSATSAAGWNRMSAGQRLKPGQRVTLFLPRSVRVERPVASRKEAPVAKAGKSVKRGKELGSKEVAKTQERPTKQANAKARGASKPKLEGSKRKITANKASPTKLASSNGKASAKRKSARN